MEVVKQEAIKQYPNEACGVIISVGKKSVALPCKNIAETPQMHFMIDVGDYVEAANKGEVVGVWHTHVNIPPTPSLADKAGCNSSELPWYIVSIHHGDQGFVFEGPTTIMPNDEEISYLGRPYVSGIFDCFGLVRDFYKREYNIHINNYPRVEQDGTKGSTFFGSRFKQEGFERLMNDEKPVRGDVFVLQLRDDHSNHLAIYLGDEIMMHHDLGRLSRREVYGGMWQKHTTHHLRHRDIKNGTH